MILQFTDFVNEMVNEKKEMLTFYLLYNKACWGFMDYGVNMTDGYDGGSEYLFVLHKQGKFPIQSWTKVFAIPFLKEETAESNAELHKYFYNITEPDLDNQDKLEEAIKLYAMLDSLKWEYKFITTGELKTLLSNSRFTLRFQADFDPSIKPIDSNIKFNFNLNEGQN